MGPVAIEAGSARARLVDAIVSRREVGRFGTVQWAMAACIAVCTAVLPHGPTVWDPGLWAVAGWSAIAAVWCWHQAAAPRVAVQYLQVTMIVAAIGVALWSAHRDPVVFPLAGLMTVGAIYLACFFSSGPVVSYLVAEAVVSGAVFFSSGLTAAHTTWVAAVGTTTVVGAVVHVLCVNLTKMASTDVLTGLPNRRAFERALTHRLAHAARAGYAVCIIAIDLDHFKDVNDALGHAAGDRALCELVRAWRRELRATDVLGRCDGDAFAVLLPASNGEDAFKVVGRLLRVGGRPFSAGVAECLPGDTAERALERAERACARAKQVGRGRAILADVS